MAFRTLCLGIFLFGFSLLYFSSAWARGTSSRDGGRVRINPVLSMPHLLPSPLTLPAGTLIYGTDLALGVTDFFQVGTSLLRTLYRVYNANAKLRLFAQEESALALTFGVESYNPSDFSAQSADLRVTSYQPGMVFALALHPRLAWFVGGNYSFTQIQIPRLESGFVRGARAGSDLTWMYGDAGRRQRVGNAVSIGSSYDFTHQIYGVGLSHHWPGFQLGIHVYPNASESKYLPILAGGGAVYF